MLTNAEIYLAIAEEAFAGMKELEKASRSPKPNGEPGAIIRIDPEQKSFKKAMISIAFSAMYFEALIFLTAVARFGRPEALKIDRMFYEDRLQRFGIIDPSILSRAKSFRESRKDLIHEKAIEISDLDSSSMRFAQKVASDVVPFIREVRSLLAPAPQPVNPADAAVARHRR